MKEKEVIDLGVDMSNMDINKLGRYCEITGITPIMDLKEGMDFRKPEYRREVFLRFYGFHLKYKSHPGAVYYVMPYLAEKYNWDTEQKLWFAFINGCTQNPLTSWVLFNKFPDVHSLTFDKMEEWHSKYWRNLDYDIDRRYQKGHFVEMVMDYKKNLDGKTQEQFFSELTNTDDRRKNFDNVWNKVYNDFFMYGRLSSFSYIEYLKIMGLNIECSNLFIYDKSGSKSHRNGLCVVNGRDDLDWKSGTEIDAKGGHDKTIMEWLEKEGDLLLQDAHKKFDGEVFFDDVNYFTLESTLCCYKSWHRNNRRYPNVYNDMFYERIKKAEERDWKEIDGSDINFLDFWDARRKYLPESLRLENNLDKDVGLKSLKQNWYRKTGQVIMMETDYNCFKNGYFDEAKKFIDDNKPKAKLPKSPKVKSEKQPKVKSEKVDSSRLLLNEDTKDSIVPIGSRWADYMWSLTPVEQKTDSMYYKREDKFAPMGINGINGSKCRQLLYLFEIMPQDTEYVVHATNLNSSPQTPMTAVMADHYGYKCIQVAGGTTVASMNSKELPLFATMFGTEYDVSVGSGFNVVIQKRVQDILSGLEHAETIERDITVDHELGGNTVEDVLNFHEVGAKQTDNVPDFIEDIIIPFGSANSTTSVMLGLCRNKPKSLKTIHLINVGVDKRKYMFQRLELMGINEIPFEVKYYDTKQAYSNTFKGVTQDDITFHQRYEAKAINYVRENLKELIKDTTLFWIIGSYPDIRTTAENSGKEIPTEIKLWEPSNETLNKIQLKYNIEEW